MTAAKFHFPTSIFNERVATFVGAFFEEMARLHAEQGWAWAEPVHDEEAWESPDYSVRVTKRRKDGAVRQLALICRRLPCVRSVGANDRMEVRYDHEWQVHLPRSYPNDLGRIAVRAVTPCYQPRVGSTGVGVACMHVNGEIDRVLLDIVWTILLDPARVQPPSLYPGRDRGMNTAAMNWFECAPHGIHAHLLKLWARAHGATAFVTARRGVALEVEDA